MIGEIDINKTRPPVIDPHAGQDEVSPEISQVEKTLDPLALLRQEVKNTQAQIAGPAIPMEDASTVDISTPEEKEKPSKVNASTWLRVFNERQHEMELSQEGGLKNAA